MAIYHLKVKTFQRGRSASAVAASAYRAGDDLVQEQGQERIRYDYSRRSGVEYAALYCPAGARYLNRQEVWNAAERSEKRKDARVAREVLVAIPHELNKQERRELVQAFATALMARYQTVIDLAIHEPHQQGDERNYHAHLLMATRRINERGEFGEKIRQLDLPTQSASEITWMRQEWERLCNLYLQKYNQRVDCRSLGARGIDRPKQPHYGPAATAWERKTQQTHPMRDDYERQLEQWRREKERASRLLQTAYELGIAGIQKQGQEYLWSMELFPAADTRELVTLLEKAIEQQQEEERRRREQERQRQLELERIQREQERQRQLELERIQREQERQRQLELKRIRQEQKQSTPTPVPLSSLVDHLKREPPQPPQPEPTQGQDEDLQDRAAARIYELFDACLELKAPQCRLKLGMPQVRISGGWLNLDLREASPDEMAWWQEQLTQIYEQALSRQRQRQDWELDL